MKCVSKQKIYLILKYIAIIVSVFSITIEQDIKIKRLIV